MHYSNLKYVVIIITNIIIIIGLWGTPNGIQGLLLALPSEIVLAGLGNHKGFWGLSRNVCKANAIASMLSLQPQL